MKFADIPEKYSGYKQARAVVLPIPYGGTSTWMKGAECPAGGICLS